MREDVLEPGRAAYRDPADVAPLELRAVWQLPDGPIAGRVQVFPFSDREAAAVHFVAKAELRLPPTA